MTSPQSVADAVRLGHRPALEAIRDKLAADLDVSEPQVSAQIAGRLQAVLDRLAELDAPEEESLEDVLAVRRAARESSAGGSPSARASGNKPHRRSS